MNRYFIEGFEKTANDPLMEELYAREKNLDESLESFKERKRYLQTGSLGAVEGGLAGLGLAQGVISGLSSQFLGGQLAGIAKDKTKMGLIGAAVGAGISGLKHYLDRKAFEQKVLLPEAMGILENRMKIKQRSIGEMLYGEEF